MHTTALGIANTTVAQTHRCLKAGIRGADIERGFYRTQILLEQMMMQRHRLVQCTLGLVLCVAVALSLLLWRLGLAPVYAGLISVNVVTLALYGYDKHQAAAGGTRIPEAALHLAALVGGSPGAILAQGLFRHKIRKRSFRAVLAAIVVLQVVAIYGYWRFTHG
jgi:uncharacterized membrane protein YsdA (DUF1294 family)